MIVLGLGSNLNDRLANLRAALTAIKKIPGMRVKQVSPVYLSQALLPEKASSNWDQSFLNVALRCEIDLEPLVLLQKLKEIEQALGRDLNAEKWSPRIIDIDILAASEHVINTTALTIPHPGLLDRPFALWPLADVAPFWRYPLPGIFQNKTAAELVESWGSRFTGNTLFHTHQIAQRIDTPQLMGIINVTADSFSDGGRFLETDKAMQQAMSLITSGAEILDIGAESTAPNAKAISEQEEWSRLEPILSAINALKDSYVIKPKISLDTRHVYIAEQALTYGIDWINDVSGLDNPSMRSLVKSSGKECVIMHHLSIPEDRSHVIARTEDVLQTVLQWGRQRLQELEKAGLDLDKIIFDPGIGFGKMAEQSLLLLQHVSEFTQLGCRLLIGHSRKSFMNNFTSMPHAERDLETAVISLYLLQQPVDYLRVHNVDLVARALRVWKTL